MLLRNCIVAGSSDNRADTFGMILLLKEFTAKSVGVDVTGTEYRTQNDVLKVPTRSFEPPSQASFLPNLSIMEQKLAPSLVPGRDAPVYSLPIEILQGIFGFCDTFTTISYEDYTINIVVPGS